MLSKKMLVSSIASLAIVAMVGACQNKGSGTSPAADNHEAVSDASSSAAAIAAASGAVSFGGFSHEDGSAMTSAELAADIAEFPALGVDFNKLQAAASASIASDGSVTLMDASGNVLV